MGKILPCYNEEKQVKIENTTTKNWKETFNLKVYVKRNFDKDAGRSHVKGKLQGTDDNWPHYKPLTFLWSCSSVSYFHESSKPLSFAAKKSEVMSATGERSLPWKKQHKSSKVSRPRFGILVFFSIKCQLGQMKSERNAVRWEYTREAFWFDTWCNECKKTNNVIEQTRSQNEKSSPDRTTQTCRSNLLISHRPTNKLPAAAADVTSV